MFTACRFARAFVSVTCCLAHIYLATVGLGRASRSHVAPYGRHRGRHGLEQGRKLPPKGRASLGRASLPAASLMASQMVASLTAASLTAASLTAASLTAASQTAASQAAASQAAASQMAASQMAKPKTGASSSKGKARSRARLCRQAASRKELQRPLLAWARARMPQQLLGWPWRRTKSTLRRSPSGRRKSRP